MRVWLPLLACLACGKDAAAPPAGPRSSSGPRAPRDGDGPRSAGGLRDGDDPRSAGAPGNGDDPRSAGGLHDGDDPRSAGRSGEPGSADAPRDAGAVDALPAHAAYPDLASALLAIIPADARVVGLGELHARTDRAATTSALASFTRALPTIGDRISDLVLETWVTTPVCGEIAVTATAKIESAVRRPQATKSEISELAAAARAAGIQAHAMTLSCADYAAIAPPGRDFDAAYLLTVTTRELTRIATSAVLHRDREATHRPWIAVYGGALHNDRFPTASVAEWSYAAEVDRAAGGHFVEVDLIVPALVDDKAPAPEPWVALARAPHDPARPVRVWTRGERSFVVVLP